MKFLKRRWVLIILIISIFLLMVGSAFLGANWLLSDTLFVTLNVMLFPLTTYCLYQLINQSRWGSKKFWKKAVVSVIIAALLYVLTEFLYLYVFLCPFFKEDACLDPGFYSY